MNQIKRTDAEWMMVWNDPKYKWKRLVIQCFEEGACVAIHDRRDQDYLDGNAAPMVSWSHYEPIPKKKTRPMTQDERVIFCCQNPTIAVRYSPGAAWMAGTGEWIPGPGSQWCTTDGGKYGEPQEFVIEVEE